MREKEYQSIEALDISRYQGNLLPAPTDWKLHWADREWDIRGFVAGNLRVTIDIYDPARNVEATLRVSLRHPLTLTRLKPEPEPDKFAGLKVGDILSDRHGRVYTVFTLDYQGDVGLFYVGPEKDSTGHLSPDHLNVGYCSLKWFERENGPLKVLTTRQGTIGQEYFLRIVSPEG